MDRAAECACKLQRLRAWMEERQLQGALLGTHGWFAWATAGGRNYVSVSTERGVAALLVTPTEALLLADNIEACRLVEEETEALPLSLVELPWWRGTVVEEALRRVAANRLVSDLPLAGARRLDVEAALALRSSLLQPERDRYRALGRDVALALTHAAFHCRPGLTEHQLCGLLAGVLTDLGAAPVVLLAAADERASRRRHPLPTEHRLERQALLVVGARRAGLHVSASRQIHFGPVPPKLRRRQEACARIDATLLSATASAASAGGTLEGLFAVACEAYAREGYPEEWQHHHQGGPTGYAGRELRVAPGCPGEVLPRQAFAWNPTLPGVKSEDTVVTGDVGEPARLEVLSATPDLPVLELEESGFRWVRPAILER
jgi:Xaa-Pro aminopeptidase